MLSREENELLCRVGPETPMGRMLRRYWIPAVPSDDLEAGAAPRAIRLLGENFVAFRDPAGQVGVLDEQSFKDKVRALAYPCYESGSLVWAYVGPPGTEPARPAFEFTTVPDSHRMITNVWSECNFVQGLEGVLDSSHSNYLHSDGIKPTTAAGTTIYSSRGRTFDMDRPSRDGRPRIEVEDTPYCFRYAAIRIPTRAPETMRYTTDGVPLGDDERAAHERWGGTTPGVDVDAEHRKTRRRENLWLQDRDAMRRGSWSGITGTQNEDFAVVESMGPLFDRTKEHLGTSDVAVIRMRRLMLDAVRAFSAIGELPPGLARPVSYSQIRPEERMIPVDSRWEDVGARLTCTPP